MKTTLLLSLLIATASYSQKLIHTMGECSGTTRRFISQNFSPEKQLTLENSPLELSKLEYLCSNSYEIVSGQMVLRSQRELINVINFNNQRRTNVRVTIYDEYSGLQIILYSWDEIDQNYHKLSQQYQLAKED